jgi:hypothetical protein
MGKGNQRLLRVVTASHIDDGKSLWANLRVCSDKFLNPFDLGRTEFKRGQTK